MDLNGAAAVTQPAVTDVQPAGPMLPALTSFQHAVRAKEYEMSTRTTPITRLGIAALAIAATSAAMLGAPSTSQATLFCDTTIALNPDAIFVVGFHNGTGADEVIIGSSGTDIITGGGGNDVICGRGGADELYGGAGNDRVEGEEGNDTMQGDADDDVLRGAVGSDRLKGGTGKDDLRGNENDDTHDGGPGADVCTDTSGLNTFVNCNP